ncbi:MAG: polysaccharide biosynthesis/export family protein [Bacteroidales bacterium]
MKNPYRIKHGFLVLMLFILALSSCQTLYPTRMLRTGKEYQYSRLPDTQNTGSEYRIAPNDELSVSVGTNDGEKMLDPTNLNSAAVQSAGSSYLVDFDGTINIPLIRRMKVEGMTIRELEKNLEQQLSFYFNKPYVKVRVLNNRVIIFPGGGGGNSQVLQLENPNTTLFEALAKAGGISDGKAYKIKLIRGGLNERKVYLIDLSKIEGLKQADMVLMANDIIYVEPVNRVPQALLAQISPYLTLFTTLVVIYTLLK